MNKSINNNDSSYNEYINGSKFRFLRIDKLMEKHIIITHITNQKEMNTIRNFIMKETNNYSTTNAPISNREEPYFYTRHRGQEYDYLKNTFAKQEVIKEMCKSNAYGIPDMLFKYDEFYNHYIRDKDTK